MKTRNKKKVRTLILTLTLVGSLVMGVNAQTYNFNFTSHLAPYGGGAVIDGYIDIATDKLIVTSWGSLDPLDPSYISWTPVASDLPLTFSAYSRDGATPLDPYDIISIDPDNFDFDDDAFAFFSDKKNGEINWQEGDLTGDIVTTYLSLRGIANVPTGVGSRMGYNGTKTLSVRTVAAPEPSSSILLCLGGLTLILRRKRT